MFWLNFCNFFKMKKTYLIFILLLSLVSCQAQTNKKDSNSVSKNFKQKPVENYIYNSEDSNKVVVSNDEWKKLLTPEQFYVARLKGTERPWSSPFEKHKEVGTYYCVACGNALFNSDTKFESGCGWPSFYEPYSKSSIIYTPDNSHGMRRTEVQCGKCKAHLGHVFDDGPPPTGLRYCINGVILDFEKAKDAEKNYENKK